MDTYSKLKLDSFAETNKVLTENLVCYESNLTTKAQVDLFSSSTIELTNLKEKIDQPTAWLTEEKEQVKIEVCDKIYFISNGLICYANSISDNNLLAQVNESKSNLIRFSEVNLIAYCDLNIEQAKAHIADLGPFGITEPVIDDVETILGKFKQNRSDRIKLRDDIKEANVSFKKLKKKTNSLLNGKLDHSIQNLSVSYPEFVNYYFAARQKSKGVQHHLDVLGYIKDKSTGEPIALGTVKVEGQDLSTHITENGTFRFKHFPEGEYRLVIENINYKTLYVSVRRYASERSKLYLTMEALPLEIQAPVL